MTLKQLFRERATPLPFKRALEHIVAKAIMTPGWICAIGTHNYNYSKQVIGKLHDTYLEIPEWLRPKMVRSISYGMDFSNGSKLRMLDSPLRARGWSFSTLAICEKALEDWEEDNFVSVIPCVGRQEKPEFLIITEQ